MIINTGPITGKSMLLSPTHDGQMKKELTRKEISNNATGNNEIVVCKLSGLKTANSMAPKPTTATPTKIPVEFKNCNFFPIHLNGLHKYLNIMVSRFHSLMPSIYKAAFSLDTACFALADNENTGDAPSNLIQKEKPATGKFLKKHCRQNESKQGYESPMLLQ